VEDKSEMSSLEEMEDVERDMEGTSGKGIDMEAEENNEGTTMSKLFCKSEKEELTSLKEPLSVE
jgi:hypothetical protein